MECKKEGLSTIELHYLAKELEEGATESKVAQIYQLGKKDLILQLHKTGKGKIMLRLNAPNFAYITSFKPEVEAPRGFCMTLRKHLTNSRLISVQQVGAERIIELCFQTIDDKKYLYVELFSKGNIVFCDEKLMIMGSAEVQKWKDRIVRHGVKYSYPKREMNFFEMTKHELKEMVMGGSKEIVKVLAADLGIGGVYAEELCIMAGLEKGKKKLDDKEITELNRVVNELRNKEPAPVVVYDEKDVVKDILPFGLQHYSGFDQTATGKYKTYCDAFDSVLSEESKEGAQKETSSRYEKQLDKIRNMISIQDANVKKLEDDYKRFTESGELIYNKYPVVADVLEKLKKARESISWKEIKEKLKGHKIIKEIKEDKGKIIIEI